MGKVGPATRPNARSQNDHKKSYVRGTCEYKIVASDLFPALRLAARFVGADKRACWVRLQKGHAPMAMVTLLTSTIKISPLYTSGPTVLMNGKIRSHKPFFSKAKGKKVSSNERNKIAKRNYKSIFGHLSTDYR